MSSQTIKAIAVASGYTDSAVASATYTISIPPAQTATPSFSPAGGTYSSAQSVSISDATAGAAIYYTLDGSAPTAASTLYTGPILVSSSAVVQTIAVAAGYSNSAVATASFTINIAAPPVTATPSFSPAGGSYSSAQAVAMSDTTPAAAIYYTVDGSTPTTSSTRYTVPITIASTTTLQAIAVATGYTNSAVSSASFTIASAGGGTSGGSSGGGDSSGGSGGGGAMGGPMLLGLALGVLRRRRGLARAA